MQASRFDTITKAAATGVTRRQVLQGLLATTLVTLFPEIVLSLPRAMTAR